MEKLPIHITMVHNYQFFFFFFTTTNFLSWVYITPLTQDQIFVQLEMCNSSLQMNKEPIASSPLITATPGPRHTAPLSKTKVNWESGQSIQESIFTLYLDAFLPLISRDVYHNHMASQMLPGGSGKIKNTNNCFHKKL